MCGICGLFGEDNFQTTSIMLDALLHRGPDGNAIQSFPWGSLGFCRLDIYGTSGIDQPAVAIDNQTAVVFNGEIYNFHQLLVLPGLPPDIRNEAELILHLFLMYGEECFKCLKGMFAIAVMTPENVILARDPLGIKPLVYYVRRGTICFASEIKALLRIQEENPDIDHEAMAETAVFGFIHDLERTMFKGIKQVLPGSSLSFRRGKLNILPFFHIMPAFRGPEVWNEPDTIERVADLMNTAAGIYVNHSKSSQAVFLSGGIDSTLITYFLQANLQDCLYSYTLYDDKDSEDKRYASIISCQFGTIHSEHITGPDECLKILRHYLYHYESMVSDGIFNVLGSLAFHILSRVISREHKVAYCGEGADELFGGYYWAHTHPLGFGDRLRARSKRIKDSKTHVHEYIMNTFPDDDSKQERMRESIFDMLMGPGLTNCHLWSVDRSSSAFSIEARPFFLWDDIRDWALSLSIENKVSKDLNTKLLLKRFAVGFGNEHVRSVSMRKKIGMPSALGKSLAELVQHSEKRFREASHTSNCPHMQYEGYFFTDIEKFLFDEFYTIFIINRGSAIADQ
jgi:asparagine synthase (glutamine-hydrolysing)